MPAPFYIIKGVKWCNLFLAWDTFHFRIGCHEALVGVVPRRPFGIVIFPRMSSGTGRSRGVQLPALRHHRAARGWSMQELSRRSGVHRNTIQRLETGSGGDYLTAYKLAEALGTQVEVLMNSPLDG